MQQTRNLIDKTEAETALQLIPTLFNPIVSFKLPKYRSFEIPQVWIRLEQLNPQTSEPSLMTCAGSQSSPMRVKEKRTHPEDICPLAGHSCRLKFTLHVFGRLQNLLRTWKPSTVFPSTRQLFSDRSCHFLWGRFIARLLCLPMNFSTSMCKLAKGANKKKTTLWQIQVRLQSFEVVR